jgi:hypothetical protein
VVDSEFFNWKFDFSIGKFNINFQLDNEKKVKNMARLTARFCVKKDCKKIALSGFRKCADCMFGRTKRVGEEE